MGTGHGAAGCPASSPTSITPAGVDSTALNVRFMQRQGVDATYSDHGELDGVDAIGELVLVAVCFGLVGTRFNLGELPAGTASS